MTHARPGPRHPGLRRADAARAAAATWPSATCATRPPGSNAWENSQPVWRADRREIALAHNGNLINAVELHAELRERGVSFRSTSDSEIIAALLVHAPGGPLEDAIADVIAAPARAPSPPSS